MYEQKLVSCLRHVNRIHCQNRRHLALSRVRRSNGPQRNNSQNSVGTGSGSNFVPVILGGTALVCVGGTVVYYFFPNTFNGFSRRMLGRNDQLKPIDGPLPYKEDDESSGQLANDVMRELEASIEEEFKASKKGKDKDKKEKDKKDKDKKEKGKNDKDKDKKDKDKKEKDKDSKKEKEKDSKKDMDKKKDKDSDKLYKKIDKLEKSLDKFARDEKKISQSLVELQQKIRNSTNVSNEEFIQMSDEITQRASELDSCLKEGIKCQCKVDKMKKKCEEEQIELVEQVERKLSDRCKSLMSTSSNLVFSEAEMNNAGKLHELKLSEALWREEKVDLSEVSGSELSEAYEEAQKKLKTMKCLLISQFLNQEKERMLINQYNTAGQKSAAPELDMEFQSKLRAQLENEMQQKLAEQKAELESEMGAVVEAERNILKEQFDSKLSEEVEELRKQHAQKFALFAAKIKGIESAVDVRADSQRKALYSHYMWLASESFRNQLTREVEISTENAKDLDNQLQPLHQFARRIEIVNSSENDPLVSTVVNSLPSIARTRGVYTEEMLKSRFKKVSKICYRLGKVDNSTGRDSLYSHFLSFLRSAFTVRASSIPAEVSLAEVDNYSLLSYAELALERGDVATCVKLLNNLKGKPSEVAHDWLREARLFLEAKQAARVISLFSTATGFATSPLSSS